MREVISQESANRVKALAKVQCGWITGVRWGPDGTTLAVAGASGVRLYAGKFGGAPAHILEAHEGHVKGVAFSPPYRVNGGYRLLLATCAADTTVKLWDITRPQEAVREVATLTGHGDSVDYVAFSPDRDRPTLASCAADGSLILWDVAAETERQRLSGHSAEVASATFALNGNVLVSGSRDNTLRLWDTQGETEGTILGEHNDWLREVRANPHGTMIASASKDGTVGLWDAYGEEESAYGGIMAHIAGADCVAFSPDGSLLASGGRDNVIRLWDVQQVLRKRKVRSGDALATLDGHERPVLSLDFNRAGTLLASGSGDNTVRLWAVEAEQEVDLSEADTQQTPRSSITGRLTEE